MSGALAWLTEWGVSFASLTGGLVTIFFFRRGLPHAAYLVGYLLLLWLVFALLVAIRQPLADSGRRAGRFVIHAADYTIQTLYHGLLLFVLPAYYASTTLTSVNVFFFLVLVAMALLVTFDPWYRVTVQPRPWLGYTFFVVSIFAVLNVALPLVGVPPYIGLLISAFAASLSVTPVVRRASGRGWRAALRVTVAIGAIAATLVAVGRAWIPPAPLFMARAAIMWDVLDLDAIEALPPVVSAAEVRQRGLVAYTAIYAPAGLRQRVSHVWRHKGRVIETVGLSPVLGGRREGYRTYSRKTSFPDDSEGRWSVDVVTASGQLIGRLRFRVVP
ncbi:MAG: hypothetical protein DME03_16695 [Candidatus Rokuibacteriota bacterium]|nr:MAG: hypothetical protein DME03_16695 [Candidatus Rokubacteria bacterium]